MKTVSLAMILISLIFINGKIETHKCKITGEVEGFNDNTKLYLTDPETNQNIDSALIINNKFIFTVQNNEPRQLIICTSQKNPKEFKYVYFWIESSDITLTANKEQFNKAIIKGSAIQDQATMFTNSTIPIDERIDSIQNAIRNLKKADSLIYKPLKQKQDELFAQITQVKKRLIFDHPDYFYSAFYLSFLMREISKEESKELFNNFTVNIKKSKYGVVVKNYIEKSKKFEIGDKAEDFHLENLKGEKIGLSDFKGKYVLLEFWSSGCGPCRMEHPNLLKNYTGFKKNGFEIFGVSLDKNRKDMENAINKDGIIWTTVSDFQGVNGDVPTTYSISYIPKNYLVNPEGIIIAIDLRGNNLTKKLEEIFE